MTARHLHVIDGGVPGQPASREERARLRLHSRRPVPAVTEQHTTRAVVCCSWPMYDTDGQTVIGTCGYTVGPSTATQAEVERLAEMRGWQLDPPLCPWHRQVAEAIREAEADRP